MNFKKIGRASLWIFFVPPAFAGIGNDLTFPTTSQSPVNFIGQDVAPQVSSAPVVVPQPPPMVRLPEEIIDKNQWRGVRCGVTEPREAVFRHDDKWRSFWEQGLAPYSPRLKAIPEIDFTKDMVVGVFLGSRETPHYEVEITSIKPRLMAGSGRTLVVRYREIVRMEGVFVPPFEVEPYHMKRVPVWTGPIVFEPLKR